MFQKKKNNSPEQLEAIAVKDFFDMILPGVVKFMSDHYICGDAYCCVWAIREYPPSTEAQAILSQLADRSNITLRVYNRLVDSMEQRKIIQNATRRNKLMSGGTDVQETLEAENNLKDVIELLANLRKNREPLLHCAVYMELKAPSLQKLKELQSDVLMELTRSKINIPYLSLDLTPGSGNLLGEFYWEILSPWRGGLWTLNTGPSPRDVCVCTLSQILRAGVPPKYYLTKRACLGILRRAKERGKPLPPQLETALKIQAGGICPNDLPVPPLSFHFDQRNKAIDLGDVAGPVLASANIQMKTFVSQERYAAGFCAGAGSKAGSIGYTEEVAPTLKASPSGNMMPSVLCLNDQGGKNMDLSVECAGTLRAQEHGHQPLVFENHGQDSRFTGPVDIAPSICAGAGEGGNNLPFALEQAVIGTLCARDYKGADNIYTEQNKLVVESPLLIRRLIPLECELLQGFPSGWTDIPGASDTARYKALGNSIAVPCAEFILGGIVKYEKLENA